MTSRRAWSCWRMKARSQVLFTDPSAVKDDVTEAPGPGHGPRRHQGRTGRATTASALNVGKPAAAKNASSADLPQPGMPTRPTRCGRRPSSSTSRQKSRGGGQQKSHGLARIRMGKGKLPGVEHLPAGQPWPSFRHAASSRCSGVDRTRRPRPADGPGRSDGPGSDGCGRWRWPLPRDWPGRPGAVQTTL